MVRQACRARVNLTSLNRTTPGDSVREATCLLRKDEGIRLRALPRNTTSKLVGLFSTLSFLLNARQGSCGYHFLKSFGMIRLGK